MALLAYLAIEGGLHRRERLVALLWPEMSEQNGRANLRTTLAILHRAFGERDGEPRIWRAVSDALGLEPGAVLASTQTIATAAALARQREAPPGLSRQLASAIAAYRGPLLDGMSLDISPEYEAWLLGQRETYHQHMGAILTRLAALQEAAGDLVGAAETLERLVRHDPLEEAAYRRLLTAYLALGESAAGLRVYEAYRAMHAAELGGEQDMKIVALAEQLQSLTNRSLPTPTRQALSLSAQVTPPLVGRAGELVALRERYAQACAGNAQVVVLAGEAGIGKTRLAAEFVTWAAAQGADVLEGRAFELGGTLPYGALVEALRPRLEQENAPDDLLSDLWLAELARLLPELADRYPDLPLVAANRIDCPSHLNEAVARLLQAWAARRPVVLLLDDVQWADDATRSLLLHAARRWTKGGAHILLLLAAQTDSPAAVPRLASWLARFGCEASTIRLDLGALTEAAAIGLVTMLTGAPPHVLPETLGGACPETHLGAWLYSASGGKPFLMVGLLHGLLETGLLGFREGGAGGWVLDLGGMWREPEWYPRVLPTRLREAMAARLEHLSPPASDLLLAAAVWGTNFTLEQLCRITDMPEYVAAEALDKLVQTHLLCEVCGTGWYSLPDEMLRTIVYTQAGAACRRVFHRRALVLLESERVPAGELARHALAAGLVEQGIAYSLAAGDAALAASEVQQAITQFEHAWQLVEATGQERLSSGAVTQFAQLGLHLGQAYERASACDQARKVYQALLTLAIAHADARLETTTRRHLARLADCPRDQQTATALPQDTVAMIAAAREKTPIAC